MDIIHQKEFSYEGKTLYSIATINESEQSETGLEVIAKVYDDPDTEESITGHAEHIDVPEGERFSAAERKEKAKLVVERAINSFILDEKS